MQDVFSNFHRRYAIYDRVFIKAIIKYHKYFPVVLVLIFGEYGYFKVRSDEGRYKWLPG